MGKKILVWGDWQLESRPPADRLDDEGRSIRFAENKSVLLEILDAARGAGCSGMVHLGDLTEERNPDSATLNAAADVFGTALKWGWEVHAAAGNHDGAFFSLTSSSFEAFGKMHDRFHVYQEVAAADVLGVRCVFLPYLHRQSLEEIVALAGKAAAPQGAPYIFAHYAYAGVTVGPKNMVLPGDRLDSTILTTVGAKLGFFGHIHKQQVIDAPHGAKVVFPGSPYCCDFGERDDRKGYAILDLETGKWELLTVQPRRRWVQVDWRHLGTEKGKFRADDLVKIVGEYGPGERPQDAFKAAVAAGKVEEPFYKVFEVRKAILAAKRGVVTAASGLQKALADYMAHRWPDDPLAQRALELAGAALKASSPAAFDKAVVLKAVRGTDFLSHASFDVQFSPGEPLLVCGENGLGKTNLIEAVLFALTGQVSKGLKMAALVRQGAAKTVVELILSGERGEYRIRRSVSLNSKGAATHKVDVEIRGDGEKWTSLADGGVADTQAALGRLIGATFLSMRAVNFQFQRDPNPFIGAEPSERKAILAEILGLDALGRAFKALNDDRLVKMRAKDAAASLAEEAAGHFDEHRMKALHEDRHRFKRDIPKKAEELKRAKAETERAIAEAGAVSSERNTLQASIDALEASAKGPEDLIGSKAKLEEAFQKTRSERATAFRSARDRAESKAALAAGLPDLEKVLAEASSRVASLRGLSDKDIAKAEHEAHAKAELDSSRAAKAAVDARLSLRDLQQKKTDASSKVSAARVKVENAQKDVNSFDGRDMGKCSKCGHEIDTRQAEADLKAARALLAEEQSALSQLTTELEAASKDLEEAQKKADSAQAVADELAEALAKADKALSTAVEKSRSAASAAESDAKSKVEAARTAAADAAEAAKERDEIRAAGDRAKADHEKAVAELDEKIAAAEKAAADCRAKAAKMRQDLAGIDARVAAKAEVVDGAKAVEADIQEESDKLVAAQAATEEAIRNMEAAEAHAEAKRKELQAATEAWAVADMASQALDPKAGLPVHLIDERLPALADSVNAYLVEFGTPEFSVSFSTRKDDGKETLDVLVDNGAEPRLDVAAYSGGQLDRIEFCLRMALGDLAEDMRDVRLGFAMMDEPGTHLDEEKKGALVRMVRERASDGRCPVAVVVSHDRKLMGAFDRRITVSRAGIQQS